MIFKIARTQTRRFLFITAVIILLAGIGAMHAHASPPSPTPVQAVRAQRPHDPHSVLVKLAPGVDSPIERLPGARHLFDDWWRIPVSASKTAVETMNALTAREDVVTVELNYLVHLDDVESVALKAVPLSAESYPNDAYYSYQWHLPQVQSDAAWNIERGSGAIVAIVDSGVSRGDDLACRTFVSPYSAITDATGEAAARDEIGHGTHVAGTIGQCTNNSKGVAGMAPDVKLMPVRVLNAAGNGTMSDVGNGIRWAADHGADVINLSLGMECHGASYQNCRDAFVDDAIAYAIAKDIVIVAAAGNSNGDTPYFPANNPDVIAVAAVDYNQRRTWYSNKGDALTISAPGGDTSQDANHDSQPDGVLQQTFENNIWDYYFLQGTSMATPHVAGAAALLRSYAPAANRNEVEEALINTAKDLGDPGFDTLYGNGLLQTADALNYLRLQQNIATHTPTPTNTATPTVSPTPNATPLARTAYLPLILKSSPPPTATPTPTMTPTATPTASPSGIYGRVTFNNGPGAGIKLELRKYNDTDESLVATAYADSKGEYQFQGVPALPAGYKYYVRFGPNSANDQFVYLWFGPDIPSYHSGAAVHGGDFDIANVQITSPANKATKSLPVAFAWNKRPAATDTYRWILFDLDTGTNWRTEDLGYVAGVTITGLPDEVQRGKAYGWYPRPYHGSDSFGMPYYYRLITFAASGNATQGAATLIHMSKIGIQTKSAAHPPFEEK